MPTPFYSVLVSISVFMALSAVFHFINSPDNSPFYSVLVSISVFMALSTVFHCINSPDNSPLSHSVLPVLFFCLIGPFNLISLYESLLQP